MDRFLSLNFLVDFVLLILLLVGGVCLMWYSIPSGRRFKYYRTSRYWLAGGYFLWASMVLWQIIVADMTGNHSNHVAMSVVSAIASFAQITIFSYSLTQLIGNEPVRLKSTVVQLLPLLVASMIVTVVLMFSHDRSIVFTTVWLCYMVVFISNVVLFYIEYRRVKEKSPRSAALNRVGWIGRLAAFFFIVVLTGMIIAPMDFNNEKYYIIFAVVDIVFYAYFFIKFINYYSLFNLRPESKSTNAAHGKGMEILAEKVDLWIAEKGYLQTGVTLQSLSESIGTNQTYLSAHINQTMNMSFKKWIGLLRIEESCLIISASPQMPIAEVAALCGIPDRSSFCRQFQQIKGITPGRYRKSTMEKTNATPPPIDEV